MSARSKKSLPKRPPKGNKHRKKTPADPLEGPCCDAVALVSVKPLYSDNHNWEVLMKCANCGAYWIQHDHERINWEGGDDTFLPTVNHRIEKSDGEQLLAIDPANYKHRYSAFPG